jgi:hypothetical protein
MSAAPITFDRFATDPQLLGHVLGGSSYTTMRAVIKAALAEPLTAPEATAFAIVSGGRTLPTEPVKTLAIVAGRGSGKTQAASALSLYFGTCRQWVTSPGQVPVGLLLAGVREQGTIGFKFALGQGETSPLLAPEIETVTAQSIRFHNGVELRVGTSDLASVRGPSYVCAIADEIATWPTSLTSASPDVETIAAVRPGLARMPGSMLVMISSPYAQEGVLYETFRRSFGHDDPHTLVVQGGTLDFNPMFDAGEIARALAEDPERFGAEYLARFRSDIAGYVDAALIDSCTRNEPRELPRRPTTSKGTPIVYIAGLDASGGRGDATALAIAHNEDGQVVIDAVFKWPSPHDPAVVAAQVADKLKAYGITSATSDQYAAGFSRTVYRTAGVQLLDAPGSRSDAYLHLLPLMTQRRVELPPVPSLRIELMGLQRRTRSGGRDTVDHRPGAHDDESNCVALAAWAVVRRAPTANQVAVFHYARDPASPFEIDKPRSVDVRDFLGVPGGPWGL